jgi:hypothetical protein
MRQLTRHHRKPKSLGGTAEKQNISRIPAKKHVAWHVLFPGNWPPQRIADEINAKYLDPDYEVIVRPKAL